MIDVRAAKEADVGPLAETLARAFEDDPLMTWMLPNAQTRRRRLRVLFAANLKVIGLPAGATFTTHNHWGAAVWLPPGQWRTRVGAQIRLLPATLRTFGARAPALAHALRAIEQAHPKAAHWYLNALGTHPDHRGLGVGNALLAPILERCDAEGLPAYLESSKQENLAFYRRYGFDAKDPIELRNGPDVWPMWREPRQPRGPTGTAS